MAIESSTPIQRHVVQLQPTGPHAVGILKAAGTNLNGREPDHSNVHDPLTPKEVTRPAQGRNGVYLKP